MIAELFDTPDKLPRLMVQYSDGNIERRDAMLRFQFNNAGPLAYDSIDRLVFDFSTEFADARRRGERRQIVTITSLVVEPLKDPLVWVLPNGLGGKALDYAVAVALNWTEPYYGRGTIRLHEDREGEPPFISYDAPDPDEEELEFNHTYGFNPSRSVNMAAHIAINNNINTQFRTRRDPEGQYTRAWIDDETRFAENCQSYSVAVCRALVAYRFPNGMAIPLSFIRADEAPAEK